MKQRYRRWRVSRALKVLEENWQTDSWMPAKERRRLIELLSRAWLTNIRESHAMDTDVHEYDLRFVLTRQALEQR